MKLKNNNSGFASIIEVVVTAIIFVLAVFGILATTSVMQPQVKDSSKRLLAAYEAKKFLNNLRSGIDQTTWDLAGSDYTLGAHSKTIGVYTINYTVSAVAGTDVRKINLTITYPD